MLSGTRVKAFLRGNLICFTSGTEGRRKLKFGEVGLQIWLNLLRKNRKFFRPECSFNCNYILITKLPWPGDSEGTFRSSSQAATCPPVSHTRRRLHTVPLIAEYQARKL